MRLRLPVRLGPGRFQLFPAPRRKAGRRLGCGQCPQTLPQRPQGSQSGLAARAVPDVPFGKPTQQPGERVVAGARKQRSHPGTGMERLESIEGRIGRRNVHELLEAVGAAIFYQLGMELKTGAG